MCQVVAAQMVKGGFRVELISQEWALFWDKQGVNGGRLPFYYIGRGTLTDADTLYDQYFRTGTTKRTNYSNPDLDKLVEEQQQTADTKKARADFTAGGQDDHGRGAVSSRFTISPTSTAWREMSIWKKRPDEKILGWDMKIK